MKTISWKFMSVFMITATATMLIVLLLFNCAILVYFDISARTELKNTFSTMNILIEKQLMTSVTGDMHDDAALLELSAALTSSRHRGNTEFFIFDEKYEVEFPENIGGTLLNGALITHIKNYDFTESPGAISRARTSNGLYFIAGMQFDEPDTGKLYIVFITAMATRNKLIGVMNMILTSIMLLSLVLGCICAVSSARNISLPIQRVCGYAKEIGNGHFLTVPPDYSFLEINQLINSMNEMSVRLQAADESQKRFLQNASHELRTPLMSIQGYSEAIENGVSHDPKEAAAIIRSESIRLTALVEELITLSKIDNNIYDKKFVEIDLGEAVSECVRRLRGLAMKEHKKITSDLKPDILVAADDSLLDKVLDNVLSNCLRYAKSEVAIQLDFKDRRAVLIVSDDGGGFCEDDLPHIFDRFYKGRGGKFGLGLAIAKKALEIMGGRIDAYNGETGAAFKIQLLGKINEQTCDDRM
jgi:two-component system sensor histidine kinase CssS